MATKHRRFPFKGDDTQYTAHLEELLGAIRAERDELQIRVNCLMQWINKHSSPPHRSDSLTTLHIPRPSPEPAGQKDSSQKLTFIRYGEPIHTDQPSLSIRYARSLFKTIPDAKCWKEWRDVYTIEENRRVISALIAPIIKFDLSTAVAVSGELSGLVKTSFIYASQTAKFKEQNNIAMKIASFHQIILISTCVVLLSMGASEVHVNKILKECLKEVEEKQLLRYRSAAHWVNTCIQRLSATDWDDRSAEMIFCCGREMSYFVRLWMDKACLDTFIEQVRTKKRAPHEDDNRIPISIPCIVKCLLGKEASYVNPDMHSN